MNGRRMKRLGRSFLLFCMAALLLAGTALANSAPPDYRVDVKVINGPGEAYYLDLLEQAGGGRTGNPPEGLDQELLGAMAAAAPPGWRPCALSAMGNHYNGDIVGVNGVHTFHGMNTPRVFRILMVTESGEKWISEPLEREVMHSLVTVDWEAGTAKMPPKWIALVRQLLATLIPTLVVEGLVLLAFGLSSKRNWLVFLLANLATQGALSWFLATALVQRGFADTMPFALLFMIPVELLIAAVEANIYQHKFRGCSMRRAFWYGIAANASSYALGWIAVRLVWAGLLPL